MEARSEQAGKKAEAAIAVSSKATLAKLRLLYESADRRMCLFEDAQGHLVCVPSHRLA